jgi:hypothetical protein
MQQPSFTQLNGRHITLGQFVRILISNAILTHHRAQECSVSTSSDSWTTKATTPVNVKLKKWVFMGSYTCETEGSYLIIYQDS